MEIVDDVDVQEKTEDDLGNVSHAQTKGDNLFYALLNGKSARETVTTTRGEFVIKFPKQKDLIAIARLAAFSRAGIPAGNFDSSGNYEIEKCATLDVTVESGPPWFERIKKAPNFTWRDMPDAGFVDEVYAKALFFRQTVQTEISGNKIPPAGGTAEPVSGGVPDDVGNGLFSGVSGSTSGT